MRFFERIFMGEVIKDFGVLEERSLLIGKIKKSLLLVKRRGKIKIAFKYSGVSLFGGSVNYFDFSADSLPKLRQYLDEAQRIADQHTKIYSGKIEP